MTNLMNKLKVKSRLEVVLAAQALHTPDPTRMRRSPEAARGQARVAHGISALHRAFGVAAQIGPQASHPAIRRETASRAAPARSRSFPCSRLARGRLLTRRQRLPPIWRAVTVGRAAAPWRKALFSASWITR